MIGRCSFGGLIPDEELITAYARCNVYVAPTLHEAFGLTPLEAMSSSRPTITTLTSGPREIVEEWKSGFLVHPRDSEALAEAVCKILGDYELASRMGSYGRRIVEERYDWKVVAGKYYNAYHGFSG